MSNNIQGWRKLFLFSLGLFAGTAFCMKWMEKDFLFQGQLFTIIGLEISYSGDRLVEILSGITPEELNALLDLARGGIARLVDLQRMAIL